MKTENFPRIFEALTGVPPFPWQTALYQRFIDGDFPKSANIPTGLGKTSTVAVWLIALAQHPGRVPRRLVYVVNRRTVVDQTTTEVEKWRERLQSDLPELRELRDRLTALRAIPSISATANNDSPLAISTLRGQFADNREWSTDPARPAVIVGTVDMIGSRLLFSGYTIGFKTRPHHAALLAQDTVLVHDEAHLEPAFQKLLGSLTAAQIASADPRKLRVIELTATSRTGESDTGEKAFGLDENPNDKDTDNETVRKRFSAVKRLSLAGLGDGEKLDARLAELAKENPEDRAVLIFTRSVETALKVVSELDKGEGKGKVATLTGTMRGKERDDLATSNTVFQRFLHGRDRSGAIIPATGRVFLVATSAGEVGVNLSADDLVCDLSTYESMAQRFGRVNRFGDRDDSAITVVYENSINTASPLEAARASTLTLLQALDGEASPAALENLPAIERAGAFSPLPEMRTATGIHFDAWALTSIREPIAARPPVAPYLHGEAEWQPPETYIAWRDDCDFKHIADPGAFLEDFPLHPRELLRDTVKRVAATLEKLLKDRDDLPQAWLVTGSGVVNRLSLSNFDKEAAESLLADAILILPASAGGLESGLLNASARGMATDVSEIVREVGSRDAIPEGCQLIHSVEVSDEDADEQRFILWCDRVPVESSTTNGAVPGAHPETLAAHTLAVEGHARSLAKKLLCAREDTGPDLRRCLVLAATFHDLGKNRALWQRNLGNLGYDPENPDTIFAKAGGKLRSRNVTEHYRHEFGSVTEASARIEFSVLSDLERDIVLHLVAAHHGRARPHFPGDEIFDPHPDNTPKRSAALATEIPRRFARLQRHFGRWGLAWLESLLRAADYAASAGIAPENCSTLETQDPTLHNEEEFDLPCLLPPSPAATISIRLNPANPGHYFACCGLFELAALLVPDASAWFEEDGSNFQIAASGLTLKRLLGEITASEISALESNDRPLTPLGISISSGNAKPHTLRIDWWRHEGRMIGKLKPWAGQMSVRDIADDMRQTLKRELAKQAPDSLKDVLFLLSASNNGEPFYFDADRAINAKAQDVGFSVDKLKKGSVKIASTAAPAIELLSLVGLQRARPLLALNERGKEREYDYHLWHTPLPLPALAAAVAGLLPDSTCRFRFSNPSRAKDYRAFSPASSVS